MTGPASNAAASPGSSVGDAAAALDAEIEGLLARLVRCLRSYDMTGERESLPALVVAAQEAMRGAVDGGLPVTFELWATLHDLGLVIAEQAGDPLPLERTSVG